LRKSELGDLFARRLGRPPGRVASIIQRAADAGLLPKATGRSVPALSANEVAATLIAVAVDDGLGSVARTVGRYGSMRCAKLGVTLETALANLLVDGPGLHVLAMSNVVFFKDADNPVALITGMTADGPAHAVFVHGSGEDAAHRIKGAETTVRIDGAALATMAAEIRGTPPDQADDMLRAATEIRRKHATTGASAGLWSREAAAAFIGQT
jgi:hypothetical protein